MYPRWAGSSGALMKLPVLGGRTGVAKSWPSEKPTYAHTSRTVSHRHKGGIGVVGGGSGDRGGTSVVLRIADCPRRSDRRFIGCGTPARRRPSATHRGSE